MPTSSFVNYYQMLGILEKEDCTTARAKVKAALTFTHPDKHPTASKDLYTEKSAVLSSGLQIFGDKSSLTAWRQKHHDELRRWFSNRAARNEKPVNSIVPAEYLRSLEAGVKWYELKNIMKWWAAERIKATKLKQEEAAAAGRIMATKLKQEEAAAAAQRFEAAKLKQDEAVAAAAATPTSIEARTNKGRTKPTKTGGKSKTVFPPQGNEQNTDARASARPSDASRTGWQPRKKMKTHKDSQEPKPTTKIPKSSRHTTTAYYTHSTFEGQEHIIINDGEDATGPSSRTRSKTSRTAAAGPGSHAFNLGEHANTPGYNIPTRKRKRTTASDIESSAPEAATAATGTGKEDISFASLFAERVRTPY